MRCSGKQSACQHRQKTEEMQVRTLGPKDPPEEEMSSHSSILAYIIPWTEEPGGL